MNRLFQSHDLEKIKAAVESAEKNTSGEIVPVIAAKSIRYAWLTCLLALLGLCAGTATALWLHHYWPFAAELSTVFALQGSGLVLGALIGRNAMVMRTLLGDLWLEHEVTASAQLAFVREGLFNTRDRTGILIFLSLRERKVVILADKGINEKVSPTYWNEAVQKIVNGIKEGSSGEVLAKVISEIGMKLAEHFPRKSDDKNELSDNVRIQ